MLFLLCALVFLGKSLAKQQVSDSEQDIVSYFTDSSHFDKIPILLANTKIDSSQENRAEQYDSENLLRSSVDKKWHKMQKVIEQLTFRLPRQIKPISYNLFLHPNLTSKSFTGNVQIQFNVTDTLPVIAVHSKKLNVTTNSLNRLLTNGMEAIPIKRSFEYDPLEYWVVEPESSLNAGDYKLDLSFSGNLDKRIVGFYGSSYFDKIKNETRYFIGSQVSIEILHCKGYYIKLNFLDLFSKVHCNIQV